MDKMLRKNYKERMGLGVAGEEFAKVVRKCVWDNGIYFVRNMERNDYIMLLIIT